MPNNKNFQYLSTLKEGVPVFLHDDDHLPDESKIEPSYWENEDEKELVIAYMNSVRIPGDISMGAGQDKVFRGKTLHVISSFSSDGSYNWNYADAKVVEFFDVVPSRAFIEHVKQVCADNDWDVFKLSYSDNFQPVSRHSKTLWQKHSKAELAECASEQPLPADKKTAIIAYMTDKKFHTGMHLVDIGAWRDGEFKYEWFQKPFEETFRDGMFSWNERDIVAFEEYDLELRPEFLERVFGQSSRS